jgi:hypothetical protein
MPTVSSHRITDPEAARGCWIEGHRGWTGSGYLVEIAESYGMPLDTDDSAIVAAYLAGVDAPITLTTGETIDGDTIHECVIELADRAEQWLNENVAPKGWAFGWLDGEFYLWPDAVWEEDAI